MVIEPTLQGDATMSDATNDVKQQVYQQYKVAEDWTTVGLRTWSELMSVSTNMAYDLALKNWDYTRSLRATTEQALAEAVRAQRSVANNMMQIWQGYNNGVKEIVSKTMR
jgi:hypothetical protein